MRILYHHRTRAEDAQGIHIAELVKAFRDLGHDVDIVSLVRSDTAQKTVSIDWRRQFRWLPNWLYEIVGLLYNLYGFWLLSCSIKNSKPDFIYERYALNTFCGVWASRYFRIPLILEVNAPLCYEQDKLGKLTFKSLARHSERWICSNASATIAVSQVMKEMLVRAGSPDEQITVMPNGIDPAVFHPGISGQSARERYGLQGKVVIGFVGWFRPWHGLESLLEILRDKRFAAHRLHLLLVGDGPAYSNLYAYAERHQLLSAVTFTGALKREDIPENIAAMDITVQPSAPKYACPMKIIEYMSMGKCVVAPDQPNIREIIDDTVSGYLFQTKTEDSFRQVLLRLISNPQLRIATGRNAFQAIFDRKLLWRANASKTVSLFLATMNAAYPKCGRSSD